LRLHFCKWNKIVDKDDKKVENTEKTSSNPLEPKEKNAEVETESTATNTPLDLSSLAESLPPVQSYNKSSFFDNISCDALDHMKEVSEEKTKK